jgi:hypothetical protein
LVNTPDAFAARLAQTQAGRAVELSGIRDGGPRSVRVVLGKATDSRQSRAPRQDRGVERLGLELQELTPDVARRFGNSGQKGGRGR